MSVIQSCCVPSCDSDNRKYGTHVTFYDFPANPDTAAKWIKQINGALRSDRMWFPRGRSFVCSKHFLQSDFKADSIELRPRALPCIFGSKFVKPEIKSYEPPKRKNELTNSPMIVKVLRPSESRDVITENKITITDVRTENRAANNVTLPISAENFTYIAVPADFDIPGVFASQQVITHQSLPSMVIPPNDGIVAIQPSIQLPIMSSNKVPPNDRIVAIQPSIQLPAMSSNKVTTQQQKKSQPKPPQRVNNVNSNKNMTVKKKIPEKPNVGSDLIEIGPNTFLKINPDVIKVNRKETPSGNTVLQFLMNQKFAANNLSEALPKIVVNSEQDKTNSRTLKPPLANSKSVVTPKPPLDNSKSMVTPKPLLTYSKRIATPKPTPAVVNTNAAQINYKNSEVTPKLAAAAMNTNTTQINSKTSEATSKPVPAVANTNVLQTQIGQVQQNEDDMVITISDGDIDDDFNDTMQRSDDIGDDLLDKLQIDTTPTMPQSTIPFHRNYIDRSKYTIQMKMKTRQISTLKSKVANLTKKIEELEDRCIVQERQLSYSFIKRLKMIRKCASKGDASATYILEQIRGYEGKNKMRWSDSTLRQCAVWCRKAPYAYEYFKKADLFRLPALGTVKRFLKKHPELKGISKPNNQSVVADGDSESSSDFDFDETDDDEAAKDSNTEIIPESTDPVVPSESSNSNQEITNEMVQKDTNQETIPVETILQEPKSSPDPAAEPSQGNSNIEYQEIILPSGEVIRFSTSMCAGTDSGNQYYIIPSAGEQNSSDHQYSIVNSDSIVLEKASDHEQLIFITDNTERVEETS